jgi:hypothetical protein
MKITITIDDFFLVLPEIENIYNQESKMNINTSLTFLKLYKEFNEVKTYIFQRLMMVIPQFNDVNYVLNDSEREIYENILKTTIDIDNHGLTLDMLTETENLNISVQGIKKILMIL